MAREFRIPAHLRDLELPGGWVRPKESASVELGSARALIEKIEKEVNAVGFVALVQLEVFETLYRLVRDASSVSEAERVRLVELLFRVLEEAGLSSLGASSESPDEARKERNAYVMAAYMCHSALLAFDDDAKKEWASRRVDLLQSYAKTLQNAELGALWSMGFVDEEFYLLWTRVGSRALAKAWSGAAGQREAACEVVVAAQRAAPAGSGFGACAAQALVEHAVTSSEKAAANAAQACATLGDEQGDHSLAGHILRELARLTEDSQTAASAKCAAAFVEELSLRSAGACAAHAATITSELLSAPMYAIRSASIAAIGRILEADAEHRRDNKHESRGRLVSDGARDALLEVLLERRLDASHFVRAASLRAWASLAERRALPVSWQTTVVKCAGDRLGDKSAIARRAALHLVVKLLEYNPYHASLDPVPFLTKAHSLAAKLQSGSSSNDDDHERRRLQHEYDYFRSAADFIDEVETRCAPAAKALARSSTTGDAVGAARFFGVARDFALPCGLAGIKLVLRLVSSPDDTVRAEAARIVSASVTLADSRAAARRACDLVAACAQQDLLCLEALVRAATDGTNDKKKALGASSLAEPRLVRALWQVAASPEDTSRTNRASAVRFLSVLSTSLGAVAVDSSALADLTRLVIDASGHLDSELALAVASLIRDAATAVIPALNDRHRAAFIRSAISSVAGIRLALAKRHPPSEWWYAAADAVVLATFAVDSSPERVIADFLKSLAAHCEAAASPTATDLARLLHVVGHVALQLAASAENIGSRLDRKRDEELREIRGSGDDQELELRCVPDDDHQVRLASLVENDVVGGDNLVSELGLVAARIVESSLNDATNSIPIVLQRSAALALAKLMCVSRHFCELHMPILITTLVKGSEATVRVNVAIALSDLAARQPNSLEPWTDHVYNALRDRDPTVRLAILNTLARLSLNDMIKAKGAGVANLARCVVDHDSRVGQRARSFFHELARKTTATYSPIYNLMPDIISRLSVARLLAKSTISEEAQEDQEQLHSSLRVDEVDDSSALGTDDFHKVMSFLLSFVDKEKHVEALAEKLCHRIAATKAQDDAVRADGERASLDFQAQARQDLAFCMSKLQVSEKSVKRIIQLLPLYKDALAEDDVFEAFSGIANKAKKMPKLPHDDLQAINDWEAHLSAMRTNPNAHEDDENDGDTRSMLVQCISMLFSALAESIAIKAPLSTSKRTNRGGTRSATSKGRSQRTAKKSYVQSREDYDELALAKPTAGAPVKSRHVVNCTYVDCHGPDLFSLAFRTVPKRAATNRPTSYVDYDDEEEAIANKENCRH